MLGPLSSHDPGCETLIYLVPHMAGLPQPAMKDMSVQVVSALHSSIKARTTALGDRPAFVGHLGFWM
jgi:hypothetical protein